MSAAAGTSALLRRAAAQAGRRLQVWDHTQKQHQFRTWSSSASNDAGKSWVLVQRDGADSTTAAGGGAEGGSVRLERRYDSGSIGGGAEQAAAPRFSLGRLRQESLSQLQATPRDPPSIDIQTLHCPVMHPSVSASSFLLSSRVALFFSLFLSRPHARPGHQCGLEVLKVTLPVILATAVPGQPLPESHAQLVVTVCLACRAHRRP